jgi:hypothetical protein
MSVKAPFNAEPERPRFGLLRRGAQPARMTPARAHFLAALDCWLPPPNKLLAHLSAFSAGISDRASSIRWSMKARLNPSLCRPRP